MPSNVMKIHCNVQKIQIQYFPLWMTLHLIFERWILKNGCQRNLFLVNFKFDFDYLCSLQNFEINQKWSLLKSIFQKSSGYQQGDI